MTIDRHNYEEFFILYTDNELNAEQCARVESFVQANPDLAEELAMFQQAKLTPDNNLSFEHKESLLMATDSSISLSNYEEWLLLYVDNELNQEEKGLVEKFIVLHPAAKTELGLLLQTKTQADPAIVFVNKESLYRKEERERRIIPLRWKLAAAAVLLLAIASSVFFIFTNRSNSIQPGIAQEDAAKKTKSIPADTNSSEEKKNPGNTPLITNSATDPVITITNPLQKENTTTNHTENTTTIKKKVTVPASLPDEEPAIAATTTNKNNPNNLPEARYNRNMAENVNQPIAFANTNSLTNQQQNKPFADVTPASLASLNERITTEETEQPEKKSKLRGLLRKVTRTFEKTTNIKATDENDRLLVAGLAIQL